MLIGHVAMQQTHTMLRSMQSLNTSVDRIKLHSICIPICIDTMPIECASGVDTHVLINQCTTQKHMHYAGTVTRTQSLVAPSYTGVAARLFHII